MLDSILENKAMWAMVLGLLIPVVNAKTGANLDSTQIAAMLATIATFILGHHYEKANSGDGSSAAQIAQAMATAFNGPSEKTTTTTADGTKVVSIVPKE